VHSFLNKNCKTLKAFRQERL